MPRASLRSVLLICAFNIARMCRVSTQITGKPASPIYAPPPVPVYSWSGIYFGGNVGYSWGQSKSDRTGSLVGLGVNVRESQEVDGVIGGVQTGYNYQFGTWVFGLETDIQASGQKGGSTFPVLALPPSALTTDHKLQWFGTTRPRLGFLATPNLLLYGTAGGGGWRSEEPY